MRRSKRLTKTNPIVRYNNPICHEYRKHRRTTELGQHNGSTKLRSREHQPDIDRQPDKIQTLRQHTNRDNIRGMERVTVHKPSDQRRYNHHRSLERTTAHKHTDQWGNSRHRSLERTTAHKHTDQWRNNRHTNSTTNNLPLAKQQPIVEGGMWSMLDRNF